MKRRDAEPRRQSRLRPARQTILVYCGAVRTEPDYFEGLRKALGSPNVAVKIQRQGVSPVSLVSRAAAYRDRQPGRFDHVWCVVDVDDFDIDDTVTNAARHKVNLAISNPCFELWLLLHHQECRSYCAGYADVAARLRKHVMRYDKARLDFADYAAGVKDAVKRGRDLGEAGGGLARNPSTSVWRLVEMIMEKAE